MLPRCTGSPCCSSCEGKALCLQHDPHKGAVTLTAVLHHVGLAPRPERTGQSRCQKDPLAPPSPQMSYTHATRSPGHVCSGACQQLAQPNQLNSTVRSPNRLLWCSPHRLKRKEAAFRSRFSLAGSWLMPKASPRHTWGIPLGSSSSCCWCRAASDSLAQAQSKPLSCLSEGLEHPAADARLVVIASSLDRFKSKP